MQELISLDELNINSVSVVTRKYIEDSVARTTRWLARCKAEMERLNSLPDTINKNQLLFGINQGGTYEDLRVEHMQRIAEINCEGYAIGGLAVGETAEEMYDIIEAVDNPRCLSLSVLSRCLGLARRKH